MKGRLRPARLGAIVLSALLPGALAAAAADSTAQTWPLDEATAAVLVEDHRAPLVSLRIEFPVGTWAPWARRVHAREAFGIQLHDVEGQLRARADQLAAGVSLSMGDRASVLHASFLREDLEEVLDLARDILTNRDFDRHELKRWKKRRLFSWKASQKQPFFRGMQQAARLLFAEGDPRRQAWEKPEPVETDVARLAAARDTLIRLPGRVVAFAGDLTREEAQQAASGLLPPVLETPPEGLEPQFAPVKPASGRPPSITTRLPRLTQVYFGYGRDSLLYTEAAYPAFMVADHVLGGHFYSRLYVALRHEGGETYGAGTASLGDVVKGPYGIATFTRVPNAAWTEEKLREVLRRFHEEGITEEERQAAVGYLRGRRAFVRRSPGEILDRHLTERRLGLLPGYLDDLVDRAAQLSLEEINQFIASYYEPSQFTLVRVAPTE